MKDIYKTVVNKVKIGFKRQSRDSIEVGLSLLELTDLIADGDNGVTWQTKVNTISFADFCRQIGFENRLEYKYRNAAKCLLENRPEFVVDYDLENNIEYLPPYTILDRIQSLKPQLNKVKGGWEEIVDLVFEEKASIREVGTKCKEKLDSLKPISNKKITANKSAKISIPKHYAHDTYVGTLIDSGQYESVENEIRNVSKDPEIILQEFHDKLLDILPDEIEVEMFELRFSELSYLFEKDIEIAV